MFGVDTSSSPHEYHRIYSNNLPPNPNSSWAVADVAEALSVGVADLTRDCLAITSQAWLLACFAAKDVCGRAYRQKCFHCVSDSWMIRQLVPTEPYRLKAEGNLAPAAPDDELAVCTHTMWLQSCSLARV